MQTLFYILFFFTPLVLWPKTSELFEFNKMIFVYIITMLVAGLWTIKMIKEKKIIFRRTLLDIPLLIFLGSQIISTIFSIDQRTSVLGYYSRFNGGLLSIISYSLLYWAYVSNMDRKKTLYAIRYTLYASVLVSIIAVLEHFGINITCGLMGQGFGSCWVQDVQNRVFSTLGQPNWLATYLVALMPIGWAFVLNLKLKTKKSKFLIELLIYCFTVLLFSTLLFTKSRSGLLGFIFADLIFWGYVLFKYKKQFLVQTVVLNSLFIVIFFIIGSPITNHQSLITNSNAPALEVGGTESGTIRKIIWKGALQVWLHYPTFGSGPETFAYSYYQFKPIEHNLVSEWDFLYNKAHNEFLNFAATAGTLGIASYFYLIGAIFLVFFKKSSIFSLSLAAGFSGLLIANFFGFSTVTTQLEFFLFPAFAITLGISGQQTAGRQKSKLSNPQKTFIVLSLLAMAYSLYAICKYWYADTQYALGKSFNKQGKFVQGETYLQNAVKFSSFESVYYSELSNSYAGIALALHELKKDSDASAFMDLTVSNSLKATTLSSTNVNLLRNQAEVFLKLAVIDLKYLGQAKESLIKGIQKAPTDAKIFYRLALIYMRTKEIDEAIKTVVKTIEMKPNYKEARYLYALILIDRGDITEAKNQLNYILEKIDPEDTNSQNLLKKL